MKIINVEIKASITEAKYCQIESWLLDQGAEYKGEDNQSDHYFNVVEGRLKLRTGNVENSLIFYKRPEVKDLKTSQVTLAKLASDSKDLLQVLNNSLGSKVVVEKTRKIFFIENVKFHLDNVKSLGFFCEIEAISINGEYAEDILKKQCSNYLKELGIDPNQLIDASYSDMINHK